ncbi:MAG: GntR family transcriptional regulator [Anaerolineaceae bacterium]|jgi:GntR family transcriptional regulator
MQQTLNTTINLSEAIDRHSPIPYYYQLKEYLASLIRTNVLKSGDRLPTEMEICSESGLSRTVVRQAIQELENEGFFVRFRAKGTFVARPKVQERLVQTLTGFYEDTIAHGQTPMTRVLIFEVIPATSKIAQELQVPVGEPVFFLKRLRFIDQEPILVVSTHIPRFMCPDLIHFDMSTHSLYRVLQQNFNLIIMRARRSIEAITALPEDVRLLGIENDAPLLQLTSTGYLQDGRPLEYYIAHHRGDRAKFDVELVRTSDVQT